MKIDGKFIKGFHEKIELNPSNDSNNVYVEHITSEKKKALRFFERSEAEKIASVFACLLVQIPTIVEVKK